MAENVTIPDSLGADSLIHGLYLLVRHDLLMMSQNSDANQYCFLCGSVFDRTNQDHTFLSKSPLMLYLMSPLLLL